MAESKYIEFSHKVSDIFDEAARVSAFTAKNIRTNDGVPLLSDFALTEDEKDIFNQGLQTIVNDISNSLVKILYTDTEQTPDTENITFKIIDNECYNENLIEIAKSSIKDCLVNGALMQWYKNCLHADLMKMYLEMYRASLTTLHARLFQFKRKKISV